MASILVVDDHPANRDLVVNLIRYGGHRPLEASDGAEALALVRAERPQLVISDILMPTMDGFEFVRRLRADPELAQIQVVFYTAHYREREARNLALACGVTRVLVKPCEPGDILRAIEQSLARQPPDAAVSVEKEFDREHLRLMTDKLSAKVAELSATNARLAALTEANLEFASQRDPIALLTNVCRTARDLVGAGYAVLLAVGKAGLPLFTTSGVEDSLARSLVPLEPDHGIPGRVLGERRARRWTNPTGASEPLGLPPGYPPLLSGLVAPVASLRKAYGWICLANKIGAESFSEEDERVLTALCAQAGRIYENGSLYAQMQEGAEKLRESELRFRQLAENIREVFWLTDPAKNQILYVSPGYAEIWDRSCESLYASPHDWIDAIHPEDRERVVRAALAQQSGGYAEEYRIVRPDGAIRWIRDRAFPVVRDAGEVYRIAGIAQDITERVRLESAFRESEAGLRRAQSVVGLAHVVTRPDGSFESWSQSLASLIGVDDERVPRSARAWLELVHPEDRELLRTSAIEAGRCHARTRVEYRLRRGEATWANFLQVMEPLAAERDAKGQTRWFSTLQDVTEQRRAQDEVRRLNADLERRVAERTAELEAANSELGAFAYSVSHDLRAPVNRINGFSAILLDEQAAKLDERGADLLRRIGKSGNDMDQLIRDLLGLSMVARGELRRVEVNLSVLAQEVFNDLQKAHPDRRVEFVAAAGMSARADSGLLRIVLENLLGNAWKYTAKREHARIEMGRERSDGEGPVFFVRDNGAGFDPSRASKLFVPFQRLHARSEFEGTGIGLATVQRILRRHGGRAWAEAQVGKGATFRFTLAP